MEEYKFASDPVANPESTVVGPTYRFTLIDDVILRYEWAEDGVFEDRASTLAINRNFPKPQFRVEDEGAQLQIYTSKYQVTYDKQRFSSNGLVVSFSDKLTLWAGEWRYGDAPNANLGGTARTLDEVDGRCDMGTGILSRAGFSALDDSSSMLFDGEGFVTSRRSGSRIDGYLFCCTNDYKKAIRSFYALSGRQPSIPRWALGNWWSRYHPYTADEYLELMDKFKAKNVPLSVAIIDMDWHIVKGDQVPHSGWTGYTWEKSLFPDPDAFMKGLHERNLKTALNDHPSSGLHNHEDLYEEMAAVLGHDTSNKKPILFDPTSPEFMHAFLNTVHRRLEERGCDFWWIDWQQGTHSRIPGIDPLWMLNHYQYLDTEKQSPDGRSLVFSRYAGPGSHRYPIGFSGDTIITWESLQFQPEFTATASNIGYGWWSHDLGGHMGGTRDDELIARWVQYGAFSPILRLHSCHSPWMSKEPWCYRAETESVLTKILQLRHRLVPYLFSMNVQGSESSLPLVQPMYWEYPSRGEAYEVPNQYYFGPAMLVAPIVHPRDQRTNRAHVKVWLPPQRYVDIFTGYVYDGDRVVDMYRSLNTLPVLASEGTIIPLDKNPTPANGCANPDAFELLVVVGKDASFVIQEDTRDDVLDQSTKEGGLRSIPVKFDQASGKLEIPSSGKTWAVTFVSLLSTSSPIKVLIDGTESSDAKISVDKLPKLPCTRVELPAGVDTNKTITVCLGPDPQLSVLDYTPVMSQMMEDFQISIHHKDNLWNTIQASQPTTSKISRILSTGYDPILLGPFLELMMSDSRAQFGGCSARITQ